MRTVSIRAFAYAIHAVIGFVVVATIAAERSPAFKGLLTAGFGHHWVAKSDLAVLVFITVALLFSRRPDPEDLTGLARGVLASIAAGALVIFGFYLGHHHGIF